MQRGSRYGVIVIGIIIFILLVFILSFFNFNGSPEDQATAAVNKFYQYEQDGTFSESWAMFHPLMKQKFEKGYYIQDRAHVFMNHFGVQTFSYSLSEPKKMTDWTMEHGSQSIDTVYQFTIEQHYKGKYGNFTIVQPVFATKVDGDWKILWDYKK